MSGDSSLRCVRKMLDCIIVGAGISGLGCGDRLVESGKTNVLVLEASSNIGGRIQCDRDFIDDHVLELGAELVHGKGHSVHKLATELKLPLRSFFKISHGDGRSLEPVNSQTGLYVFKGIGEPLTGLGEGFGHVPYNSPLSDFVHANTVLDDVGDADSIQLQHSMKDYFTSQGVSKEMIHMMESSYANTLCSSLSHLSAGVMAKWERYWESECYEDTDMKFTQGASFSDIIEHLSKNLQGKISLNSPVDTIDLSDPDFIQVSSGSNVYQCKTLVLAFSPTILHKIEFKGMKLSREKQEVIKQLSMRMAMKVFLLFESSTDCLFMKEYSGAIIADYGLPEVWFDFLDTKELLISCFMCAEAAEDLMEGCSEDHEAVMKTCVSKLTVLFPCLSNKFIRGKLHVWNTTHTPYIGGGYVSPNPGLNVNYVDTLKSPIQDRLFFCGEAFNSNAGTTSQAALDSGREVANLLLAPKI